MKGKFLEEIARAESLEELDEIVEAAAFEIEANAEYEEVYTAALDKARSIDPRCNPMP